MKPIDNYDEIQPYQKGRKLPPGGYVVGIISAAEKTESWGRVLEIKFDIAEGDYRKFFTDDFEKSRFDNKRYKGIHRLSLPNGDNPQDDNFKASVFKANMEAIEASNPGFTWKWAESTLTGKKVGAIFFKKEYDYNGKQGFFTTVHSFCSADDIRNGNFEIPPPKMLKQSSASAEFVEMDVDDESLPF